MASFSGGECPECGHQIMERVKAEVHVGRELFSRVTSEGVMESCRPSASKLREMRKAVGISEPCLLKFKSIDTDEAVEEHA